MDLGSSTALSKRPSPRVQKVLKILRFRMKGVPIAQEPWKAYKFGVDQFDELQYWLKKDKDLQGFVGDKVRYDYDSKKCILVSRWPTVLQSLFSARVTMEIRARIDSIVQNSSALSKAFARDILHLGSATMDLLNTGTEEGRPKLRRDPDAQFGHLNARWPSVILELSYPKKRRVLPHMADDYILETDGDVRVLVGLDIDTDTKRGTISTWRPLLVKDDQGEAIHLEAALCIDNEVFRDESGNPNSNPNAGLRLNLEDFGPPNLTKDLPAGDSVFIDSATLCRLLTEAEEHDLIMSEGRGVVGPLLRKRKRRRIGMESESPVLGDKAVACDMLNGKAVVLAKAEPPCATARDGLLP